MMSGPGPVAVFCGFWDTNDVCRHLCGARDESQDLIHVSKSSAPDFGHTLSSVS